MYGVINQCLKDLLVMKFGKKAWEEICYEAQSPVTDFFPKTLYPDKLTLDLAGAAARTLSVDLNTVLFEFGRHCLLANSKSGYCLFNDLLGNDFRASIHNLTCFPDFLGLDKNRENPFEIEVTEVRGLSLLLQCRGGMPGIDSVLSGVIKGIATYHDVDAKVSHFAKHENDAADEHVTILKVQFTQAVLAAVP